MINYGRAWSKTWMLLRIKEHASREDSPQVLFRNQWEKYEAQLPFKDYRFWGIYHHDSSAPRLAIKQFYARWEGPQ